MSSSARIFVRLLVVVMCCGAKIVLANDAVFDDSVFEESVEPLETKLSDKSWYSTWSGQLYAAAGFATANHSFDGFNREDAGLVEQLIRAEISKEWQLHEDVLLVTGASADYRYYSHQSRPDYLSGYQYKESEQWVRPEETYIQWIVDSSLWLQHGYYIVSYGMADAFDVMDKLTPRDNTRWGQELSANSREPLWLSQASWGTASARYRLTITHQFQGNRVAAPGSDYDSSIEFRSSGAIVKEAQEPEDFEPEWIVDARGAFPAGDWAIMVGEIYSKESVIHFAGMDKNDKPLFDQTYTRTRMVGAGADYVINDLVWKAEVAWLENYQQAQFTTDSDNDPLPSLYQTLLGLDFVGPMDTRISIETRLTNVEGDPTIDEEVSIQLMKDALRERLYTQVRLASLPDDAGRFYQLAVDYDITDYWNVSMKYTDYLETYPDNYFSKFENSDRFLLGVTFQF